MHKQARFLPPAKNEGDKYALNGTSGFSSYSRDFLKNLSSKMAGTQDTASEPRAPSPFGRVWQFRRSLAGDLGDNRKKEAVSTFRGILALIALRDYFHLPVELGISPLLAGEQTKLAKLFQPHVSCTPSSEEPDCPPFLWHGRMPYFYFRLGTEEIPFAGYSPLTLVYPAAKKLPLGLANQIFWWDSSKGSLTDPTSLPANHAYSVKAKEILPKIKKWLSEVRADQTMKQLKLASEDLLLLRNLLGDWEAELSQVIVAPGDMNTPEIIQSESLLKARSATVDLPQLPSFFRYAIPPTGTMTHVPTKIARHIQKETFIISLDHIGAPTTQIYGTVYGSPEIKEKMRQAPSEGDDLGKVLGISAPKPYVVLDGLFEPVLPIIYQSSSKLPKLSLGWHALTLENKSYLYPFTSTLLNYFSIEEIVERTKIADAVTAVGITFEFNASRPYKTYIGKSCPIVDTSMDLRLFPNFALDTVPDVENLLPMETDRRYYARLRLYQGAKFNLCHWLNKSGEKISTHVWEEGNFDDRGGISPGKQLFWQINDAHDSANRPAILAVQNSGMLFTSLEHCSVKAAQECEIGLDFGTSNTCVFIKTENNQGSRELELPVFTTSLLDYWDVDLGRGNAAEGYSALFDFPYQNKNYPVNLHRNAEELGLSVNRLNPKIFFPTQVVHHNYGPIPEVTAQFSLTNGLAFFQNITVTSLSAARVSDLIEGFDKLKAQQENASLPKRFILERNLKWDDDTDKRKMPNLTWRYVFHRHLRLQVVLAAARVGAKVTKLLASYPKAFITQKVGDYQKLLSHVWGVDVTTMSESAAAAADSEVGNAELAYLIDIGGGTADYAIYHDKKLIGEASFRMAGSFLEEYFCKARSFRTLIADNRKEHPEFKEPLNLERLKDFDSSLRQPASGNELLLQNVYQGLLSILHPKSLIEDAIKGKTKASTGFILSNIILYSGLAYAAGLIQRTLTQSTLQYKIGLRWGGNGSCFLNALSVGGVHEGFEKVLAGIFRAASGLKEEVSCRPLANAKTIVASGLLKDKVSNEGDRADNVASKVFSHSLFYRDNGDLVGENDDCSLTAFYSQNSQDMDRYEWDGLREGTFKHFLVSLQTAIKGLKMGDANFGGSALGLTDTSNWAVEYVSKRKESIATKFKSRMHDNYKDWHQTATTDPGSLQVEPLFITEVCAMLEDIREHCGGAD